MEAPARADDADMSQMTAVISQYPYFVPARYIRAGYGYKSNGWSADLLTAIYPYKENWLQLNDFAERVHAPTPMEDRWMESRENTITENEIAAEPTIEPTIEESVTAAEEQMPEQIMVIEETIDINDAEEHESEMPEMQAEVTETETVTEEREMAADTDEENEIEEGSTTPETETEEEPIYITEYMTDEPAIPAEEIMPEEEMIFTPVYAEDYFYQQGIKISGELPEADEFQAGEAEEEAEKSLMVMMSFTEWLLHFKSSSEKQQSEAEGQKAIKTMWQKEKLAAALEEENEEIPENVFEMAVNSITKEEGLASESLADIYIKQQKYDQAIEMYRKLSLRNPQKNAYFARKIEEVLKEKQS